MFDHVVYRKPAGSGGVDGPGDLLLVLIDGDGTPWARRGSVPARDPTPRRPLALGLLGNTTAIDGIYVGRPCYHGRHTAPGCTAESWTAARYSNAVVESIAVAIRREIERTGDKRLLLVGYSGGGVIAMLLAHRLPEVAGVVTIAANLDIDAWTAHHGYLDLTGSLNPARLDISGAWIEIHLIGGRDRVVPHHTVAPYLERRTAARTWIYPEFDHVCCWEKEWPAIIARIETLLSHEHY